MRRDVANEGALGETGEAGWSHVPEFGVRRTGSEYDPRPGAYAVISDGAGNVAVIRNCRGCFLPGGGIEPGETPDMTLAREVREECRHELGSHRRLGEAIEYVLDAGHVRGLLEQGVFYLATLGAPCAGGPDSDDELCWLPAASAPAALTLRSQSWVAEQALRAQKG